MLGAEKLRNAAYKKYAAVTKTFCNALSAAKKYSWGATQVDFLRSHQD